MHIISYLRAVNKLETQTRVQIFSALCEGASMRSVSRLIDTSINTVSKLLEDAGRFCAGLSKTIMFWEDFVAMMDADQPAKNRGHYKKTA